jgi:hypothetical protein
MATPIALNSENYPALNESIIDILKAGKRPLITIYTNAEGTVYASDSHGDIINREVLSASYTASYKDADGNMTNPFVVVKFKDGEGMVNAKFIDYFTTVDYVEDHWYTLSQGEIQRKRF